MVGAITSTGSLYVGMNTAARCPGETVVTGAGARVSRFHRVTARMMSPMTGKASNAISSQAATRFQPTGGRVKTIRHVT